MCSEDVFYIPDLPFHHHNLLSKIKFNSLQNGFLVHQTLEMTKELKQVKCTNCCSSVTIIIMILGGGNITGSFG